VRPDLLQRLPDAGLAGFLPGISLGPATTVAASGGPGQRKRVTLGLLNKVSRLRKRGREKGVGGELHRLATLTVIMPVSLPPASSSEEKLQHV
jgi:hypothetical protein